MIIDPFLKQTGKAFVDPSFNIQEVAPEKYDISPNCKHANLSEAQKFLSIKRTSVSIEIGRSTVFKRELCNIFLIFIFRIFYLTSNKIY